jgi:hypothetical protein
VKLFERVKIIYGQYGYACVNACFCKSLDERRERERGEKKEFKKNQNSSSKFPKLLFFLGM